MERSGIAVKCSDLLGAVGLRGPLSEDKQEHAGHDAEDEIAGLCVDWKGVSYAT